MRTYRKIKYWLYIIRLSFRWMWIINLGDEVYYGGKLWIVRNGVSLGHWDLMTKDNTEREEFALITETKKRWTLRNIIGSFRSGYRFYMTSWYRIWVDNGVEPWMRSCNIWGDDRTKEHTR